MKNSGVLRLVWENINGDVCEMVPANDDLVHLAEMDGRRFFESRDGEAFEVVFGKALLTWEALPSLLKNRCAA